MRFLKQIFGRTKSKKNAMEIGNRLSCIIDFAKQFNFYIHYSLFISIKIKSVVVTLFFS